MNRRSIRFAIASCIALSSSLASAQNVWVVDSSNGPGTQFTDLPQAVAFASDGDVLDVRTGAYSVFTLSGKGLTIVGSEPVYVVYGGTVTISNTSSTQTVSLSRLTLLSAALSAAAPLSVQSCSGPVLLDTVAPYSLNVSGCADVRARFVSISGNDCAVNFSRFELVTSNVSGRKPSADHWPPPAASGGAGIAAHGSLLHLAGSIVRGGVGGDTVYYPYNCFETPGTGGPGVRLSAGSSVLCARGRLGQVRGGLGGSEPSHIYAGSGGPGADVDATSAFTLSTGAALSGGPGQSFMACSYPGPQSVGVGPVQPTAPRQPVLEIRNRPFGSSPIRVMLFAPAGSSANLLVGSDMSITNTANVITPLLTSVQQTTSIGVVPAGESLAFDLNVGTHQLGDLVVVQAEVTLAGGAVMRSNSIPVVYR